MSGLPKRYNFKEVEPKWQKYWEEKGFYKFDRRDRARPTYSIDTPPPYPSGELHVGNALNFSYIDFVARYKRMRGFNVLFPIGWDCHGLPTEVRVEKTIKKSKREVPPHQFLELCRKYTLEWIKPMREALRALGCSIDWSTEYMTMNPDYWRRTQLSFLLMYEKGLIYRDTHPVVWCPRCETAIAEAEVEYVNVKRKLHYFKFPLKNGGEVIVASTRPELLASCVALAVNPSDERYCGLIGETAIVPIYGREIPVIADEDVETEFGTGVVMICTYGDKIDVKWQKRHGLPVIVSIDERGRMRDVTGPLKGLTVGEARERIVELLKSNGFYVKQEEIESSVGTCWRCHTPVEILPKEQWFVATRRLSSDVLEAARSVSWIPSYSYKKLEDWVNSLDWDWVISRQRIFATPIPVWYCLECGNVILAPKDKVPVDPRIDPPVVDQCPRCGSTKIRGETDVMDTWMDSSITSAVHAGWPDDLDERLFPADLQPNGYDIIRTWDYYLLVRGVALFGKPQFKTALINGMVLREGKMMHKSYGNYVSLLEVIDKYGADAFRLWAAITVKTGSDVNFTWAGLDYAKRFLTKIWNIARYVHLVTSRTSIPEEIGEDELKLLDKWILSEAEKLTERVTQALEDFDFQTAATSIINFAWHRFADHYIEATKYRVGNDYYGAGAVYTLYNVLFRIIHLLSIFTPHICEEIYHRLFRERKGYDSITLVPWPSVGEYSEEVMENGSLIIHTIATIRRAKQELRIPLSKEISSVAIHAPREIAGVLERAVDDIKGTIRARALRFGEGKPSGRAWNVEEYPDILIEITP